ncbi:MAG: sodium-dependent transporter [Ruminococcaceae bacterium]|nr:sodium-dependent transporter [Oscillospiraceae bacterium]
MEREKLGSRLGFILLSAGCAIGVGNVWKFPWMAGQNGGGVFVFIYFFFLVLLGLPVMVIEFSLGRASQTSPVRLYQKLRSPRTKWRAHGYGALVANVILVMFYSVVTGWILHYFVKFFSGGMTGITDNASQVYFKGEMLQSPAINVGFMAVVVVLGFLILSFGLQNGVERVTKFMMIALLGLMIVLAVNSFTLSGAKEGLEFYLKPDFTKINGSVIVAAMNQAFFTLSLGMGSMAIFGSYIGKERSLLGESVNILVLDTFVAIVAGLIIFPACFTFDVEPAAGPSLLFEAMAKVFNNMQGGRWWGTLFFLFMFFAAMSTIIAVFQNILACVQELLNWKRVKACIVCCAVVLILSVPCALGFNLWSGFAPFKTGSSVMDLEDFIVSNCFLPLGSLCYVLFSVSKKGWGFENFLLEANAGKGMKLKRWMKPYFTYVLPAAIVVISFIGIFSFEFADDFTLWGAVQSLFS